MSYLVLKKQNEQPEIVEIDFEDNTSESSKAWHLTYKIQELVGEDAVDHSNISREGHCIVVGDTSALIRPVNFVMTVEQNLFHKNGLAEIHGPTVFIKRKYLKDFGLGYISLRKEEAEAIVKAFSVTSANNENGDKVPVFMPLAFNMEIY